MGETVAANAPPSPRGARGVATEGRSRAKLVLSMVVERFVSLILSQRRDTCEMAAAARLKFY